MDGHDYSERAWLTDEEEARHERLLAQETPLSRDDVEWILATVPRVDNKYPESWSITCPALVKKLCADLLATMEAK